jgi:hypothetical protein
MGPETWIGIPQWLDAKRAELERRLHRWPDLNDLIRDVLVTEHQGVETADDLPHQEAALRALLSEELRRECPSAQGKADSDFYLQVSQMPITDKERTTPTYIKFISQYVTEPQKLRAIRSLAPKQKPSS